MPAAAGETAAPTDLAMVITPDAAERLSGATTAMVYDWREGTSIWDMLKRSRSTSTARSKLGMKAVVRISAVHDPGKQHQSRIIRKTVFFDDRIKRTFLPVVPQFRVRNVKGDSIQQCCFCLHAVGRYKIKFRVFVHEFFDKPGTGDTVDLDMFTSDEFHN